MLALTGSQQLEPHHLAVIAVETNLAEEGWQSCRLNVYEGRSSKSGRKGGTMAMAWKS
jgi:hypothetical protein